MSYQSILVHVDDSERVVVRLGAAARLARSFDAELIGAYTVPTAVVTPSMSAVIPDSIISQRMHDMGEAQNAAEALFRAAASRARVATVEWRAPVGEPIPTLIEHARCTDLVVVGPRDPDDPQGDFDNDLVNGVLLQSGRPVMVVPYTAAPQNIGGTVIVAWNGSRQSARAVADAMPLLARAEKVYLLSIAKGSGDDGAHPDQRVLAWLRYHGIEPVARHYRMPEVDVGELILSQTADLGADLIVMGGYSRSRLQEMVLGGVTRLMLEKMTVPVVMAH